MWLSGVSMFELHPQLANDCVEIARLPLCRLLLLNDAQYPWCILVPARENLREIYELSVADRAQFMLESCVVSELMQELFKADKMNVAALGNMVPQLHVHHIARYQGDRAWPGPVWGVSPSEPYEDEALQQRCVLIQQQLKCKGLLA
jgi:diadenosine tetraphosphate (Ap4A) HIT family hydrolase